MILEIADIHIQPGKGAAFENAVRTALKDIFPKAKGFVAHSFHACMESPERYVLQLTWQTLEDHTVLFRESTLFTEWRALVGSYFAKAPHVQHFTLVSVSAAA
jgi:heme-degrading monooxygenase HmoA